MSKPFVDVAVGLMLLPDGQLLLARRPPDKPWPGWWELPGGKIEAEESVLEALARELHEELGIEVIDATPWITYIHEYPKTIVRLAFCQVTAWHGTPASLEGQELAWIDPRQPITVGPLLPATEPPLRWLTLPDRYLLTSIEHTDGLPQFLETLRHALARGLRLVQFREPAWALSATESEVFNGLKAVVSACHDAGATCFINSCHPQNWWPHADGVHLRAADAAALSRHDTDAPRWKRMAMSAHTSDDIALAQVLDAEFVVVGHVLPTPSHPNQEPLGWSQFANLARRAGRPVFAIGGQSPNTLHDARRHGAHGIAGIRHIFATPA